MAEYNNSVSYVLEDMVLADLFRRFGRVSKNYTLDALLPTNAEAQGFAHETDTNYIINTDSDTD